MDYPLIAVVGTSGTGKSYSLRNLPIETTRILNIERKPLPFKQSYGFGKNLVNIDNPNPDFTSALEAAINDPKINVIVIESGTKYFELLLNFCKKSQKGYDIYNLFNSSVMGFLEKIKANKKKIIIFIAIPEIVKEMTAYGGEVTTRRIEVKGKEWEGKIDKEFTIVLYTDVKQDKGSFKADYRFMVNNDGTNSAKSPPDMFGGQQFIPNDLNDVVNKVMAYYGLKPNYDLAEAKKEEAAKILTSSEAGKAVNTTT